MIGNIETARGRVRLILDRANSPWLTDSEINNFIELGINEYIRERVGSFGSDQKVRDDFGQYVKSIVFGSEPESDNPDPHVKYRQFVNYSDEGVFQAEIDNIAIQMDSNYTGGEFGANNSFGVGCRVIDDINVYVEGDRINFGYLVSVKSVGTLESPNVKDIKVVSLDDIATIAKDPFRSSATYKKHAFRIGDIYWVKPGNIGRIVITYVSNNNNILNLMWLPNHGREEVCQIAARKILGTTADERYSSGDIEIKQLEGK